MHTLLGLFPAQKLEGGHAFSPLPNHYFFSYFLVPHVVASLIADDFATTISNGHSDMIESSNPSKLVNPERDDDDELNIIYCQNMLFFRMWNSIAPSQQAIGGDTDGINDAVNALLKLKGGILVRVFSN